MKKILTVALLSVLAIAASAQELNNFSRGRQQVKSPEINGEKVRAEGSNNFPKHYHEFVNYCRNILN